MSAAALERPGTHLLRAGLLTALVDGTFSSVLSVAFYHSTVARLFQGVASTLLGPSALTGGTRTALLGVAMHVGVAFGWSAVFLFLVLRAAWVRQVLAGPFGVLKVAAVYGPCIWLVMSLVVIPLLLHRPPAFGVRWLVQLIGHFPFVGLPIVASLRGAPIPAPPRTRAIAAGALLLFVLMPRSTLAAQAASAAEDSVRAVELARGEALLHADTVALSRMTAEEFMEISRFGLLRSRAVNLREIATGDLHLLTVRYDSLVVRIYGDVAVLRGITDNTGTFRGIPFSGKLRYLRIFVRRDGRWQAVAMQHTAMP